MAIRLPERITSVPMLRLAEGTLVLGAGAGADVILEEPTVSRRHVELQVVPEGIAVRDLKSRNGTFYLGQRIHHMTVGLGACIRLGNVEVRIEPHPDAFLVGDGPSSYGQLIALSASMRRLFALLERLEGSLVNVLVEGESGTGKELVARAIHEHSAVARGPFVAVNCGAIQRELVRSELFGHKKGAFTGASESSVGAFEAAADGTLFLDEIGELPLDVQPMLLRALEERAITRVGENTPRPTRVRLLAATNRTLEESVQAGQFRRDLYYRLMVVRLQTPAMRERPEDVRLLSRLFAANAGAGELPESVLRALEQRPWPGNVRELRHAVESYLAIGVLPAATRPPREGDGLEAFVNVSRSYQELKDELHDAFLRLYLARLVAHTAGNVSEASRLSGLERSYLNKLVRRMGVKAG